MPERVQMTRQRPWRAENPDAVIVARPSKWGNPFSVKSAMVSEFTDNAKDARALCVEAYVACIDQGDGSVWWHFTAEKLLTVKEDARRELAGRDLACWCPLDQPCHADVLLELANVP